MQQYQALTGRRPTQNYADLIRAEAPEAKSLYFQKLARDLEQKAIDQQEAQYQQQLDLMNQQNEDAEDQSQVSNLTSGAGLLLETYPYIEDYGGKVIDGAGNLIDMVFPETTSPAIEGAMSGGELTSGIGASDMVTPASDLLFAESAADAAGAAGAAGDIGGAMSGGELTAGLNAADISSSAELATDVTSSGGGGYSWQGPAIGAIIALQQLLGENTNTVVDDQPTSTVFDFSGDESFPWNPRFGNDPWKGYLNDRLDIEPTAGEKWDASIWNAIHNENGSEDWGKVFWRTPAAVSQWADPVGDTVSDIWGGMLDKNGVNKDWQNAITGSLNPINAVTDAISDIDEDSYICGATHNFVGMDKKDLALLNQMYAYAFTTKSSLAKFYMKHGKELVRIMTESVECPKEFYSEIKKNMLMPVVNYLKDKLFDDGLQLYIENCRALSKEFAPEMYEQIPEE